MKKVLCQCFDSVTLVINSVKYSVLHYKDKVTIVC